MRLKVETTSSCFGHEGEPYIYRNNVCTYALPVVHWHISTVELLVLQIPLELKREFEGGSNEFVFMENPIDFTTKKFVFMEKPIVFLY